MGLAVLFIKRFFTSQSLDVFMDLSCFGGVGIAF